MGDATPESVFDLFRELRVLYSRAASVAEAGARRGLQAAKAGPYEDGFVLLYGPIGRAYASISVTDDGDLVGLTTDGAGHVVAWEYAFSDETMSDAVERVAAFLADRSSISHGSQQPTESDPAIVRKQGEPGAEAPVKGDRK